MKGFNPVLFFELTALCVAIFRCYTTGDRSLLPFIFFLIVTNFVEWGNYFGIFTIRNPETGRGTNTWIFNVYNPLGFGFFAFFFRSILTSAAYRKRIPWLYIALLISVLINILFVQGIRDFDSYTYLLGCMLMLYCVYLYLSQLIKNPENTNIFYDRLFWISIGCLFFYLGEFPLMSFFAYFQKIRDFSSFVPIYRFFSPLLNIVLYTCLSISFLCRPKRPNI